MQEDTTLNPATEPVEATPEVDPAEAPEPQTEPAEANTAPDAQSTTNEA